jgi:3-phosphoshikimate 1-carboxyvinyltransferase
MSNLTPPSNPASNRRVGPAHQLIGKPMIPGDKSISHRGLIFGALALGTTEIHHLLESGDVQSTAACLKLMGVEIRKDQGRTFVKGCGVQGLKVPRQILDCGNSGTTIRLLMGLLSGIEGMKASLTGDHSLIKRPMKRVAAPLRDMGAKLELTNQDFAPLTVTGVRLKGIHYKLPIASAQIKTAVLLAALCAEGETRISGEIQSRDHTERLLEYFGVNIETTPLEIRMLGGQELRAKILNVPGDPSTAAFWMAAACMIPNSDIELHNISLNPTRIGFIKVLERMGANIRTQVTEEKPEPIGTIRVTYSRQLNGTRVEAHEIPTLIDELPMLAVLATQAKGITHVSGAEELRVKETDRIEAVAKNLRAMHAKIETTHDGFIVEGRQKLRAAELESYHDHRIAMAFSIGALVAEGECLIKGADCVGISYPEFFDTLKDLTT